MVKVIDSADDIPTKGVVIVDFFANWCGPCKRIAPVFEELAQKVPEITFLKVNVDDSEALSSAFDIEALPTFVCIKDSKVFKRIEGADLNAVIAVIEGVRTNN
jgi:thioredoxin 1